MVRHTGFRYTFVLVNLLIAQAAMPDVVRADIYHGFTLVDPATEKRIENAWIVVEGGRIARIGSGKVPPASESTHAHDLAGRFVLPGLIDAHAHVTSTGI